MFIMIRRRLHPIMVPRDISLARGLLVGAPETTSHACEKNPQKHLNVFGFWCSMN
jgi:hypothetical protein